MSLIKYLKNSSFIIVSICIFYVQIKFEIQILEIDRPVSDKN